MTVIEIVNGVATTADWSDMSLERMQKFVGGCIQHLELGGRLDLFFNEEGKILELPMNIELPDLLMPGDYIAGPAFICSSNEDGDGIGLTPEQAQEALRVICCARKP